MELFELTLKEKRSVSISRKRQNLEEKLMRIERAIAKFSKSPVYIAI